MMVTLGLLKLAILADAARGTACQAGPTAAPGCRTTTACIADDGSSSFAVAKNFDFVFRGTMPVMNTECAIACASDGTLSSTAMTHLLRLKTDDTNSSFATDDHNSTATATAGTRALQEVVDPCTPVALENMLGVCCPQNGGGHRRAQNGAGCDALPDTCDRACATVFVPFFFECSSLAATLGTQGASLYTMCQATATGTPAQCVDDPTWSSTKGNVTCGQYAEATPNSWHAMCAYHAGQDGRLASEGCPVSCGECPTCEDNIKNGDETGVDCGGSQCPPCVLATSCGPLADSRTLSPHVVTSCTGEMTGDNCSTLPMLGYQASTLADRARTCRNDDQCTVLATQKADAAHTEPGWYTCGPTGKWEGTMMAVIPIDSASCPPALNGPHFSGTCTAADECHAKCDSGYRIDHGSSTFSCLHGTWMGELTCVPFDCGITLDGSDVETSAFAPCTGGTGVGDACIATCSSGYYSTVGNGQAEFICTPLDGNSRGLWMQQGFSPWWESSLQCTKCPTIQNCVVASCSTGTDAQCTQCDDGYYAFRHDEEPTRCLQVTVTLIAAGFSPDSAGLFSFKFAADNRGLVAAVPSDLAGSSIVVPATSSLSLEGTGAETIGSSFTVRGGLMIANMQLTGGRVTAAGFSAGFENVVMNGVALAISQGTTSLNSIDMTGVTLSITGGSTALSAVTGTMSLGNIRVGDGETLRIDAGDAGLTFQRPDQLQPFAVQSGGSAQFGGPVTLTDAAIMTIIVGGLFSSNSGTLSMEDVTTPWLTGDGSTPPTFAGTIPGTLTATIDGLTVGALERQQGDAEMTVTPPEFLPTTFAVRSGPCATSNGGRCVGRGSYGDNEQCTIDVLGAGVIASCPTFNTESCCDHIDMAGQRYSGSSCPQGVYVFGPGAVSWTSDSSVTGGGWTICL